MRDRAIFEGVKINSGFALVLLLSEIGQKFAPVSQLIITITISLDVIGALAVLFFTNQSEQLKSDSSMQSDSGL